MSELHATLGAAEDEPQERVGLLFTSIYALAYFGLWMALLTPIVVSLALRIAEIDPANKEGNLSLILGIGAVVALVANPVAGYFSDRTTSRFGMRRPWLVGGVLVGTIGLYLIATGNLTMILIGWLLAQLGFNAVLAAIVAILPDQVPVEQRGTVSGVLGICLQLGIVAGVFLTERAGGNVVSMFMWPAYICAGLMALLVLFLDDRRLDPSQVKPIDLAGFFKSFWISPKKAPDFAWAFLSRFMLFIGLATLTTYQVFFLIDHLGVAPADIPVKMLTATLIFTAATVVGSLGGGSLSDRLCHRSHPGCDIDELQRLPARPHRLRSRPGHLFCGGSGAGHAGPAQQGGCREGSRHLQYRQRDAAIHRTCDRAALPGDRCGGKQLRRALHRGRHLRRLRRGRDHSHPRREVAAQTIGSRRPDIVWSSP